ncbi:MAG: ABC transporter permease [Cyclobacteriaceae bacterium]
MLRNFFIVAVRNFLKQRTQSILNVSGFAIGLACSIYVYLYAFDELTYDTQYPDPENTYRLLWKDKGQDGQEQTNSWAILGWAHYMKENLKGVKSYSSLNTIRWPHSFYYTPQNGDQRIVLTENVVYATNNYADFFYLDLLAGDPNRLLEQPTDLLISETAAHELFGNESPLNKQLEFSHPYFFEGARKANLVVKALKQE